MKNKRTNQWVIAAASIAALAATAQAIDRTWIGLGGGGASTDVNDANNWNSSGVPGAGDKASFNFAASSTASIDIPTTAGLFAPDSIVFSGNGNGTTSILTVNKDLTLTAFTIGAGGTTAANFLDRVKFSTSRSTTIELTGNNPLDVSTNVANWRMISAGTGSNYTTFNLSGSNITFNTLVLSASADKNASNRGGIRGGQTVQTAVTGNPQMNFTATNGTVTLQTAGSRPEGTLGLGFTQMGVYSTQSWNYAPDANNGNTSFIRMGWRSGSGSTDGPEMIRALDSLPLSNLGNVNIVLDMGDATIATSSNSTTAMRIAPGTYGGLLFTSERDNNGIQTFLKLNGDASFTGRAVEPGFFDTATVSSRTPAATTAYGIILRAGDAAFQSKKRLELGAGRTLSVTNGVILDDRTAAAINNRSWSQIDATGATLTVGGDLILNSVNQHAGSAKVTFNMGIYGNASTNINLAGNFSTNVASPILTVHVAAVVAGLSSSTVSMVGGIASVKTYEVADYSSKAAVANGYGIGTLNIGTATTPGRVQLVNQFVNDDTLGTAGGTHDGTAAGEKLMVTNLNIANSSTLDVNGQIVFVGGSLSITGSGQLDLNTDSLLAEGMAVMTFVGSGDQVAAWTAFASNVIDSDNPSLAFTPILSAGSTVWQTTAAPEPGMMSILLLGALGLRRRRRPA